MSDEVRLVICGRDGVGLCELANAELDHVTWELNAPGEAVFKLPTIDVNAQHIELWKRELQVWFGDQLRWQGPLMTLEADEEQMEISAEGLLAYFRDRFVDDGTLEYTSIDQLNIAWNLIAFAQAGANRDFNIDAAAFGPSGVTRSRKYLRNDHEVVLDLLEAFTTLDNGFDYEIVPMANGQRLFTPHYPKQGVFKDDLSLEWGGNVVGFKYNESSVDQATQVYVTGGTNGDVKFEQNYEDVAASVEYGVKQAIISDGSQKDVTWLMAKAVEEVEHRKDPLVEVEVTAIRIPEELLFELEPGDRAPLEIDRGRVQVNDEYRVTRVTYGGPDSVECGVEKWRP